MRSYARRLQTASNTVVPESVERNLVMMNPHVVLKKILRTEKGMSLNEANNQYFFDVSMRANKIQIKQAVEEIYKVKVKKSEYPHYAP